MTDRSPVGLPNPWGRPDVEPCGREPEPWLAAVGAAAALLALGGGSASAQGDPHDFDGTFGLSAPTSSLDSASGPATGTDFGRSSSYTGSTDLQMHTGTERLTAFDADALGSPHRVDPDFGAGATSLTRADPTSLQAGDDTGSGPGADTVLALPAGGGLDGSTFVPDVTLDPGITPPTTVPPDPDDPPAGPADTGTADDEGTVPAMITPIDERLADLDGEGDDLQVLDRLLAGGSGDELSGDEVVRSLVGQEDSAASSTSAPGTLRTFDTMSEDELSRAADDAIALVGGGDTPDARNRLELVAGNLGRLLPAGPQAIGEGEPMPTGADATYMLFGEAMHTYGTLLDVADGADPRSLSRYDYDVILDGSVEAVDALVATPGNPGAVPAACLAVIDMLCRSGGMPLQAGEQARDEIAAVTGPLTESGDVLLAATEAVRIMGNHTGLEFGDREGGTPTPEEVVDRLVATTSATTGRPAPTGVGEAEPQWLGRVYQLAADGTQLMPAGTNMQQFDAAMTDLIEGTTDPYLAEQRANVAELAGATGERDVFGACAAYVALVASCGGMPADRADTTIAEIEQLGREGDPQQPRTRALTAGEIEAYRVAHDAVFTGNTTNIEGLTPGLGEFVSLMDPEYRTDGLTRGDPRAGGVTANQGIGTPDDRWWTSEDHVHPGSERLPPDLFDDNTFWSLHGILGVSAMQINEAVLGDYSLRENGPVFTSPAGIRANHRATTSRMLNTDAAQSLDDLRVALPATEEGAALHGALRAQNSAIQQQRVAAWYPPGGAAVATEPTDPVEFAFTDEQASTLAEIAGSVRSAAEEGDPRSFERVAELSAQLRDQLGQDAGPGAGADALLDQWLAWLDFRREDAEPATAGVMAVTTAAAAAQAGVISPDAAARIVAAAETSAASLDEARAATLANSADARLVVTGVPELDEALRSIQRYLGPTTTADYYATQILPENLQLGTHGFRNGTVVDGVFPAEVDRAHLDAGMWRAIAGGNLSPLQLARCEAQCQNTATALDASGFTIPGSTATGALLPNMEVREHLLGELNDALATYWDLWQADPAGAATKEAWFDTMSARNHLLIAARTGRDEPADRAPGTDVSALLHQAEIGPIRALLSEMISVGAGSSLAGTPFTDNGLLAIYGSERREAGNLPSELLNAEPASTDEPEGSPSDPGDRSPGPASGPFAASGGVPAGFVPAEDHRLRDLVLSPDDLAFDPAAVPFRPDGPPVLRPLQDAAFDRAPSPGVETRPEYTRIVADPLRVDVKPDPLVLPGGPAVPERNRPVPDLPDTTAEAAVAGFYGTVPASAAATGDTSATAQTVQLNGMGRGRSGSYTVTPRPGGGVHVAVDSSEFHDDTTGITYRSVPYFNGQSNVTNNPNGRTDRALDLPSGASTSPAGFSTEIRRTATRTERLSTGAGRDGSVVIEPTTDTRQERWVVTPTETRIAVDGGTQVVRTMRVPENREVTDALREGRAESFVVNANTPGREVRVTQFVPTPVVASPALVDTGVRGTSGGSVPVQQFVDGVAPAVRSTGDSAGRLGQRPGDTRYRVQNSWQPGPFTGIYYSVTDRDGRPLGTYNPEGREIDGGPGPRWIDPATLRTLDGGAGSGSATVTAPAGQAAGAQGGGATRAGGSTPGSTTPSTTTPRTGGATVRPSQLVNTTVQPSRAWTQQLRPGTVRQGVTPGR